MSREILFRGKQIDNGKWVQGYVCRSHRHRGSLDSEIESYYFNKLDDNGWASECVVLAETVCQYTGLTDKKGRKIFEGDIIRYEKKLYVVKWIDGIASFSAKPLDECRYTPCMNEGTMKCSEIIGNIFDNPELIGE